MVPYKVDINGFKRFKKISVLLDKKLLAFVGANEAGKSSFLNALLSIENNTAYKNSDITKGLNLEQKDKIVEDPVILINAINIEIDKRSEKKIDFDLSNLPKANRIKWFEKYCKNEKRKFPTKVKIAKTIASLPSDTNIVNAHMRDNLITVLNKVEELLS